MGSRFVSRRNLCGLEYAFDTKTSAAAFSKVYGMVDTGPIAAALELGLNDKHSIPYSASICARTSGASSNRYSMTMALQADALHATPAVTLGFLQQIVARRKIYNPLEDKRVRFIANYIDMAIEASRRSAGGTDLAAGVSWQPNKNLLLKGRVSSAAGVSVTAAVKSWWKPTLTLAGTAGVSNHGVYAGVQVRLQNVGEVGFARPETQSSAPEGYRWETVSDDGDRFPESGKITAPQGESPSLLL